MSFSNQKKTFLEKLDKSKKGSIDERIKSVVDIVNSKEDYYTTSSCSGRAVLWGGSGKKNETEWLKVSHDLITEDFFAIEKLNSTKIPRLIWLRVEPMILHIACKDLPSGNTFLNSAKKIFKKSCFLSIQNKIILEVRGSEFIEMPLFKDGKLLLNENFSFLVGLVNQKLEAIFAKTKKWEKETRKIENNFSGV